MQNKTIITDVKTIEEIVNKAVLKASENIKASNQVVENKERLNTIEAANFLGFSKPHLYRLTSQGRIPHYKKGKFLTFKKSELEEWLLSKPVKPMEQQTVIEEKAKEYLTLANRRKRKS